MPLLTVMVSFCTGGGLFVALGLVFAKRRCTTLSRPGFLQRGRAQQDPHVPRPPIFSGTAAHTEKAGDRPSSLPASLFFDG